MYLYESGIVHLDMATDNLFIRSDGGLAIGELGNAKQLVRLKVEWSHVLRNHTRFIVVVTVLIILYAVNVCFQTLNKTTGALSPVSINRGSGYGGNIKHLAPEVLSAFGVLSTLPHGQGQCFVGQHVRLYRQRSV